MIIVSRRAVPVVVGVLVVSLTAAGCVTGGEERAKEYALNDLENEFEVMDGVVDVDMFRTPNRFARPGRYVTDIRTGGLTEDDRVALVTEAYRIYWEHPYYPSDRPMRIVVMDRDDPSLGADAADADIGDDEWVDTTELEAAFGPRP